MKAIGRWLLALLRALWRAIRAFFAFFGAVATQMNGTPLEKRRWQPSAQPEAAAAATRKRHPVGSTTPPAFEGVTATEGTSAMIAGSVSATVKKILDLAEEIKAAAMTYDEEAMKTVIADFNALPQAMESIADAWRHIHDKASVEFPVHPQVIDLIESVRTSQAAAAHASAEIGPTIQALHNEQIDKLDDRRQAMWDHRINNQV